MILLKMNKKKKNAKLGFLKMYSRKFCQILVTVKKKN